MRFNQIVEAFGTLNEISMRPSILRQLAADINAKAGMEFEMIVPNISTDEDNQEPDYDANESSRNFSQIEDFFADGEYNSRRDVRSMIQQMQEKFYEWLDEKIQEDWAEQEADLVYSFVVENVSDEDILDFGEYDDEDRAKFEEDPDFKRKVITDYVDNAIEKQTADYDGAREEFGDDARSSADEEEWLDQEFPTMLDVSGEFDIGWPHYYNPDSGDNDIDSVADSFKDDIGKPVVASSSYHSATRNNTDYIVEPDSSLEAEGSDGGLEFISPPMPVDEMFSDMDKIVNWANNYGCYTNASTGLHMNISVPDMSTQKLDFVKLALLMGDEYVLEKFERLGNYYAKSAMQTVRERVAQRPEDAGKMLEEMKERLNALATKVIHSGETSKYTSINTKDGYVEFRSPGGDWLASYNEDKGNIENTMLRFVVALDAAMDPEKYRNEYLKKLYKLLAPKGENDTLAYFAKFAAGELPQSALKSFVRQAQLERKVKKDGPAAGGATKQYTVTDRTGYAMLISAESAAAAKDKAEAQYPDKFREVVSVLLFEPPVQTPAAGSISYDMYNPSTSQVYRTFYAANDEMAIDMGNRYRQEIRAATPGVGVGVRRTVAAPAPAAGEQRWKLMMNNEQVFVVTAATQGEANRKANEWLLARSSEFLRDHQGQEVEVVPMQ
jgi:hypothetical protein